MALVRNLLVNEADMGKMLTQPLGLGCTLQIEMGFVWGLVPWSLCTWLSVSEGLKGLEGPSTWGRGLSKSFISRVINWGNSI